MANKWSRFLLCMVLAGLTSAWTLALLASAAVLGTLFVVWERRNADPMIPLAAFQHARGALTRLGFSLESHVSPGLGHSIDAAGLELGGRFLARVLK